jgi:predicted Ser/Thr protein kinase
MALDYGPTRAERSPGEGAATRIESSLPLQPERLGPYRLVSRLGEGGMGVVHLALDRHGRAVAIKVLRPHVAYDPEARWRLEREMATLQRIRSDRVAAVIDADISGDRPYLVTRYVAGPSLDDVVTDEGPLRPEELVVLGRGLVEALDAIHGVGVVHRDLKPGNILLEDGEPVVIDFGIAHIADDVRLTSSGLVMGTPGYLSPEVIGGSPVTQATDWWGWAASLAFAASGRPPFGRGPMDVVLGRVRHGEADLSGVDSRLTPLLAAALSPDPGRRPPAREVVSALERYASGSSATVSLYEGLDSAGAFGGARSGSTAPIPSVGTDVAGNESAGRDGADPRGEAGAGVEAEFGVHAGGDAGIQAWLADWDGKRESEGDLEESDWEAAWDADPEEPDPRIGRPLRTGTVLALGAVFVAASARWPGMALLVAALWCWFARFSDRSVTALILRRYRYGRRRADMPMAVVLSPWHLVVSAGLTVVGLLLPLLVAVSAAFCTTLGISAATSTPVGPASGPAVAVGFAAGALLAWWGPGGSSLRRGSRSLIRGVARSETAANVIASVLVAVAVLLLLVALARHGQVLWWPFPWRG